MVDAGDIQSDIQRLMAQSMRGQGPSTLSEIRAVAQELADRLDDDPAVLEWLRQNAMPLIGQQLLVASVAAVQHPAGAFETAMQMTTRKLGADAAPGAVIAELMESFPGPLRAWLIAEQLPRLIVELLQA